MNEQNRKIGIIQVILSGICFGFLGYFGKMAYSFSISPGELLALSYSVSAFLLFIYLLITDKKILFLKPKKFTASILLGIFGYALFSSMFFYALKGLSASLTVLLLYTYPIIIALISKFFLHEALDIKKIISIIIVSTGLILLVSGEWKIAGINYLLSGLGAAFFYSLYIIYSRKLLQNTPPLSSSLYVQVGAGVVLSIINFSNLNRIVFILNNHFIFILLMAFICSFLAMSLFLSGLSKISSIETSILSTTEPISGIIISYFMLGERMTFIQIVGGIFILLGVFIISFDYSQKGN